MGCNPTDSFIILMKKRPSFRQAAAFIEISQASVRPNGLSFDRRRVRSHQSRFLDGRGRRGWLNHRCRWHNRGAIGEEQEARESQGGEGDADHSVCLCL